MNKRKKPEEMTPEELEEASQELYRRSQPDFDPMAPHPTFLELMILLVGIMIGVGIGFTLTFFLIQWLRSLL